MESDWSYVNQRISPFGAMSAQVGKAVARGADLEATRTAVNLDSFRPAFAATSGDGRLAFDLVFLNPGIESAYNQLKPDGTKK